MCSRISSIFTTRARKLVRISSAISCAASTPMSVLMSVSNSSADELVVDQLPLALEEVADVGIEELSGLLQTLLEFFE